LPDTEACSHGDRNGRIEQKEADPSLHVRPVTEPTRDPTGGNTKHTAHLYVFVPMFSVDNDQNPNDAMPCPNGGRPGELCGPALGATLIKLFGFVPEAWKTHPLVSTQCPDLDNPGHAECAGEDGPSDRAGLRADPKP